MISLTRLYVLAARDVAQEIYTGMYSPGGVELCHYGCSLESCLAACYLEERCLGLTVNTTSGGCSSHRDSGVCDIARIDPDIVQINIGQCCKFYRARRYLTFVLNNNMAIIN